MIVSSNRAVESETSLSSYYFLHGAGASQEDERENHGGGYGNAGGVEGLGFDLWMVDKHRHRIMEEEAKRGGGGRSFSASGGKIDAFQAKEKDMDVDSNIPKKKELKNKDAAMFHNIISSWILKVRKKG